MPSSENKPLLSNPRHILRKLKKVEEPRGKFSRFMKHDGGLLRKRKLLRKAASPAISQASPLVPWPFVGKSAENYKTGSCVNA
jgi:hypothetical protein